MPSTQRSIKVYDFKRPDKFSKDQIRTVAIMHETFARLITTAISAMLRSMAHVHVASVDQLTYEEFLRSIPNPTTIGIIHMDPLKGSAVLEMDPPLTSAVLDRLFGGPGMGPTIARQLTDIERSVMEGIFVRLLGSLRTAWMNVIDLKPRLGQIETNPQFAQIVPPSEMIVLVTLATKIGEATGMMNLVLPFLTIEPIISKLSAQYWYSLVRHASTSDSLQALLTRLAGFEIPAEVYLEGEEMSLHDLGELRKGSVVKIPGLAQGEALLRMGERTLFRMNSRPGKRGNPPVYSITGGIPKQTLPQLRPVEKEPESSRMEEGFREALKEFGAGIGAALSGIKSGIGDLRQRQEAMADQLSFGSSDREAAELPGAEAHVRPFDFIRRADPAHLVSVIQQEHPQLIALVLSYLEPQTASAILGSLPLEMQPDIAKRIAAMQRTAPEVLREVERVLEKILSTISAESYTAAGGVESIVEILNLTSRSVEKNVVETLEKADPDLAEEIKKRMFVFEDIILLGREITRKVIEKVNSDDLARAMKATPEEVRAFLWECMSKSDAEKIKARLDELGRVRLHDVEESQQRIVAKIRVMEENGEIVVARPGEMIE
jgi:flagellar motor switch protein FliM